MPRTIEISVSEELLHVLDERAKRSGVALEEYASALLSRDLSAPPTMSEVLEPFREAVAASGITDSELAQLFSEARDEAYGERRR